MLCHEWKRNITILNCVTKDISPRLTTTLPSTICQHRLIKDLACLMCQYNFTFKVFIVIDSYKYMHLSAMTKRPNKIMEIVLKILMFDGGEVGKLEIIKVTLPCLWYHCSSAHCIWANFQFLTSYNVLLKSLWI